MSFFAELKRRNVVRVGIAYVVIGWLLAQVAELAFDAFGAPDWVLKSILVVLLLGLPLVLFIAWAFEITPEGVKREKDVDRSQSITRQTGRRPHHNWRTCRCRWVSAARQVLARRKSAHR
jgi:hypothetical protein